MNRGKNDSTICKTSRNSSENENYLSDLSHGGYQDLDDIDNPSENIIPTHDPFKLLTNLKRLEPYFDPNVNQNVTALVGKSAYLNCVVKNLGNKTVECKPFNIPFKLKYSHSDGISKSIAL